MTSRESTRSPSLSRKSRCETSHTLHTKFGAAYLIISLQDLNDDLKVKQNELKTLEEACEEIELFDEDEQIPYLIGEVFISHNLPKTQELLATAKLEKNEEIKSIQDKCKELEAETATLKGFLYQRFGNNIYLENDE